MVPEKRPLRLARVGPALAESGFAACEGVAGLHGRFGDFVVIGMGCASEIRGGSHQ